MQEGRGEALPHRPFGQWIFETHRRQPRRIKGLSTNAAPHATNEEREAMAKSSFHAPKESPPLPGFLISKESETLYPASQRKKPHKKEPSSA